MWLHFDVTSRNFDNKKSLNTLWCFHTRARQRQYDKTNVEPVHSYDAFHTRSDKPGVNWHHRNAQVQHLSCRCLALV